MLKRLVLVGILAVILMAKPGGAAAAASVDASVLSQEAMVLLVKKSAQTLTVYKEGKAVKDYRAVFGVNPNGDKVRQGDNRTPEGSFYITEKERIGDHPYLGRKWFGISYPDVGHAERALQQSLISHSQYNAIINANYAKALPPQNTTLGGWIGIHGGNEDLTKEGVNWTEGCIAMLDKDLEELYAMVGPGTKVIITA
jgi:murein L,D-transpeptidase YafK